MIDGEEVNVNDGVLEVPDNVCLGDHVCKNEKYETLFYLTVCSSFLNQEHLKI